MLSTQSLFLQSCLKKANGSEAIYPHQSSNVNDVTKFAYKPQCGIEHFDSQKPIEVRYETSFQC